MQVAADEVVLKAQYLADDITPHEVAPMVVRAVELVMPQRVLQQVVIVVRSPLQAVQNLKIMAVRNILLYQVVKELIHEQPGVATPVVKEVEAEAAAHHFHLVMDMMPE